jgi:murein L,D-transpeptidase YcbB/YkuD
MSRFYGLAVAVATMVSVALPVWAQEPVSAEDKAPAAPVETTAQPPAQAQAEQVPAPAAKQPATPLAEAIKAALQARSPGITDEERNEYTATLAFYEKTGFEPLWVGADGAYNERARAAIGEMRRANEWGLNAADFPVGERSRGRVTPASLGSAESRSASLELDMTFASLKYGRYARGGRITAPVEQLSSYLDRRPQLLKPAAVLDGLVAAEQPDAYLRGLHPQHEQFKRLRERYLVALSRSGGRLNQEAKTLRANMEQWRWMPENLGDMYIWNNIPDFTQRVIKDGEVIRKANIVVGQIGKETPIFTRNLKKITFRPQWKVPDSIKVRELLPSLQRGGGLMTKWALEVRTKDGQLVNWRKMKWDDVDIREYDVIQPNGPMSVMGKVKFSFPNQHTVFMHDTAGRDAYMLHQPRRTYSHGCMRLEKPLELAKIVLREDKGWDPARVLTEVNNGVPNNEIAIDKKIPIHMTYFTAIVNDDGRLSTFPDVYGHERRITLALDGRWNEIEKGKDHLAPVELSEARSEMADDGPRRKRGFDQDDYSRDMGGWRGVNRTRSVFDALFGGNDD